MGYLGLDGETYKEDNLFQRLFWPGDHAGEAELLGQQGFWICSIVAILSMIVLSVQGLWIVGMLSLFVFVLGGIGVREHSTTAAILLALVQIFAIISGLFLGHPPGFLGLVFTILLLANIRGTWIARRWSQKGDPEVMPERMKENWKDILVDQLPPRIWPIGRFVFFPLCAVYLLLLVAGTIVLIAQGTTPNARSSQTINLKVRP